jgi:hypothetical protein
MTVKDFRKLVLDRYSSSTEQRELAKLMRQLCGHPFYCNSAKNPFSIVTVVTIGADSFVLFNMLLLVAL